MNKAYNGMNLSSHTPMMQRC